MNPGVKPPMSDAPKMTEREELIDEVAELLCTLYRGPETKTWAERDHMSRRLWRGDAMKLLEIAKERTPPTPTREETRHAIRLCAERLLGVKVTMSQEREFADAILALFAEKGAPPSPPFVDRVRPPEGDELEWAKEQAARIEGAPPSPLTPDDIEVIKSAWARESWNTVQERFFYSCNYCNADDAMSPDDEVKHKPDCILHKLGAGR